MTTKIMPGDIVLRRMPDGTYDFLYITKKHYYIYLSEPDEPMIPVDTGSIEEDINEGFSSTRLLADDVEIVWKGNIKDLFEMIMGVNNDRD